MTGKKTPTRRTRPAPKRREPSDKPKDPTASEKAAPLPGPKLDTDVEELVKPERYKAALAKQIAKLPEREQIVSAAKARIDQSKKIIKTTSREDVKNKIRTRKVLLGLLALLVFTALLYVIPAGENRTLSNFLPSLTALLTGFFIGSLSILFVAAAWYVLRKFGLRALIVFLSLSPFVVNGGVKTYQMAVQK